MKLFDDPVRSIWRAINKLEQPLEHCIFHQSGYTEKEDLQHQQQVSNSLTNYQEKFFDVAGLQKTLIAIHDSILALSNQSSSSESDTIPKLLDAWLIKVILFQLACIDMKGFLTAFDSSQPFFEKAEFAFMQIETPKYYRLACFYFGMYYFDMACAKEDAQRDSCLLTAFRYFAKCHNENITVPNRKVNSVKDFIFNLGYHFLKESGMDELKQQLGYSLEENDSAKINNFVQHIIDKVSTLTINAKPALESNGRDTKHVVADLEETLPIALNTANKYRAKAIAIQRFDDFLSLMECGSTSIDDPVEEQIAKSISLVKESLCTGFGVKVSKLEAALTTIYNSKHKELFNDFIAKGNIDFILEKKVTTFEEFKIAFLKRNFTLLAVHHLDTYTFPDGPSYESFVDEVNAVSGASPN